MDQTKERNLKGKEKGEREESDLRLTSRIDATEER